MLQILLIISNKITLSEDHARTLYDEVCRLILKAALKMSNTPGGMKSLRTRLGTISADIEGETQEVGHQSTANRFGINLDPFNQLVLCINNFENALDNEMKIVN